MINENKISERLIGLMEPGFFGVIKEGLNLEEIENLKMLASSKDPDNYNLAFMIAQHHGRELSNELFKCFLEKVYGANNLDTMEELWLNGFNLQILPEGVGDLSSLWLLNLQANQLTSLPESIGELTSLQLLSVADNQLEGLPESIGNLTNLTRLMIDGNNFEELPEFIGNLTSLRAMNLGRNNFQSLPESIGNLTSLEELWILRNPISSEEQERIREMLPNCKIYF